jgi:protein-disulfide isomerase
MIDSKFLIPGAIVAAGLIVAGAIAFSNSNGGDGAAGSLTAASAQDFGNRNSALAADIRPIDANDHLRGNPDAKVTIVEYSDFECPFCRSVHPTISQIIDDYPEDVNWVYRHFPLTSIHSRALEASNASECVAELGGNGAFWTFTDTVFNEQGSLGRDLYARIAGDIGLSSDDFEKCVNDTSHQDLVRADLQDAVDSGGTGTPFIVIVNGNGDVLPFSGALPYENFKSLVEEAIRTS